tara:strand:+ start:1087 stop:1611 length:525 start_codon:yes stop_codon:yes gene_type:complete
MLTISCGNKSSKRSVEDKNPQGDAIAVNDMEKSPCELLTESEIKKSLSIPNEAVTEFKDVVRTYPSCFYKWEAFTFSKSRKLGGQEVSVDYPTEVGIVVVKNATEKMFQTSTKVYKDGQAQQGIGEMAVWGTRMSQLTFLAKGKMIHLNVSMSNVVNENKAQALSLAALIINKL